VSKRLDLPIGKTRLSIYFNNPGELENELNDINKIKKIIEDKLEIEVEERSKVREDVQDIFDTDGKYLIFKKSPTGNLDKVMLAVYGYGSNATLDEIEKTTGIKNPSKSVIYSGKNKKYFLSNGRGGHHLSSLGIQTVTEKIIPNLRNNISQKQDKA
jgi:hypothetical protein